MSVETQHFGVGILIAIEGVLITEPGQFCHHAACQSLKNEFFKTKFIHKVAKCGNKRASLKSTSLRIGIFMG